MPSYNTAPPSAIFGGNNTINSVTVNYGIRDFLLNLNLGVTTGGIYPTIGTHPVGGPKIGEPVLDTLVGSGNVVVPNYLPLETYGLIFKDENVSSNTFQNQDSTANDLTQIDYLLDISNPDYPNSEWPSNGNQYPQTPNEDVDNYGILAKTNEANYRKDNTIKNLYLDASKQLDASSFIDFQPLDISQQISGYLDVYGGLNLGGSPGQVSGVQIADIAGSILNGQGLGLAKGGIVTNFDIRASLAGRVLTATGFLNDTKLGVIGGQQLVLALANNAAFNTEQSILGSLNLQDNIISLAKGEGLEGFRPSYKITVPSGGLGRVADTAAKILGFTLPRSYLDDSGSIFQSENGGYVDNIERANKMIENTGKGQNLALISNLNASLIGTSPSNYDNPQLSSEFRSGYAPAFTNNKGEVQITRGGIYAFSKALTGEDAGRLIDGGLLASSDSIIPNLSYLREEKVRDSGFLDPVFNDENNNGSGHITYNRVYNYLDKTANNIVFSWGSQEGGLVNSSGVYSPVVGDRKSLLVKTQKLFNSKGMLNIVTAKGDMNKTSSQLEQSNGYGFSKGNAVMSKERFNEDGIWKGEKDKTADETYCRSWTTLDRYDTVQKLVRHRGLYNSQDGMPFRHQTEFSVLDDNGFAKIAPYTDDEWTPANPKRYMFSIENLAWADDFANLPLCEQGPGDLVTGKRGRIMWFPPYDINFTENNSVNWESTNFIGRGEPVYTYNNTERSGTLSFKVIVDHPNYVNALRDTQVDDHYVNSFWAGCIDEIPFAKNLSVVDIGQSQDRTPIFEKKENTASTSRPSDIGPFGIFYPNDNYEIAQDGKILSCAKYEDGKVKSTNNWIVYVPGQEATNAKGNGCGEINAKVTKVNVGGVSSTWTDNYNYGLNSSDTNNPSTYTPKMTITSSGETKTYYGWNDIVDDINNNGENSVFVKYMTNECKYCRIECKGYASIQGYTASNQDLVSERGKGLKEFFLKKLEPFYKKLKLEVDKRVVSVNGETIPATIPVYLNDNGIPVAPAKAKYTTTKSASGCVKCPASIGQGSSKGYVICPTDSLGCKLDRKGEITIKYSVELEQADKQPVEQKQIGETITTTITTSESGVPTECDYFDKLTQSKKFIFDSFREKIRYFHPAFHSTTPEGLNSRLTFLLQCTRQGPTNEKQGATNLAFGRPPVCILRIGDFYNTKIVIDNIGIDYEPLVWDLNPEGIGVQPMIANVNMSFKFIGGSTLMGPLNKLQNALSFNYFANTHVYDTRANYLAVKENAWKVSGGSKNASTVTSTPTTTTTTTYFNQQIDESQNSIPPVTNQANDQTNTSTGATDTQVLSTLSYVGHFKVGDDTELTFRLKFNKKEKNKNPDPDEKPFEVNNLVLTADTKYQADVFLVNSTLGENKIGSVYFQKNGNSNNSILYSYNLYNFPVLAYGTESDTRPTSIDEGLQIEFIPTDTGDETEYIKKVKEYESTTGSSIKIIISDTKIKINSNFTNKANQNGDTFIFNG